MTTAASCALCGHAIPADLEQRATTRYGRVTVCRDDRACLRRWRPQLAAELARQDPDTRRQRARK